MRDPFHHGQRAMQERTGERDVALMNGRLISDCIPAAAKQFVGQQHYCVLGWSSPGGEPWATFLGGPQGFARTDEEGRALYLRLDDATGALARIPPFAGLRERDHLGVLFIELGTRRRLRVSGRCTRYTQGELAVSVDRAYPLCPKYIQRRQLEERDSGPVTMAIQEGETLTAELVTWITSADTCFVASARPDRCVDISHRGGRLGFIRHQAAGGSSGPASGSSRR